MTDAAVCLSGPAWGRGPPACTSMGTQSGHLWATLPQLTQNPSRVTEAMLLCYERKAWTQWPRQDGAVGTARGSGQLHSISHFLFSFREQQAQYPRGREMGLPSSPHWRSPHQEGSQLQPALSSSVVFSLLPNIQVSPELLFKTNLSAHYASSRVIPAIPCEGKATIIPCFR